MQISKKTTTVIYNQAEKKKPPNIYRYLTQSKPITGKAEKRYRLPAIVSQMQKCKNQLCQKNIYTTIEGISPKISQQQLLIKVNIKILLNRKHLYQ